LITISKYDKRPGVTVSPVERECAQGWGEILEDLRDRRDARRIAIECFHGVQLEPLKRELVAKLGAELVLDAVDAMLPASAIEAKFAEKLSDDPVFGFLQHPELEEFFDEEKVAQARGVAAATEGRVVAIGTGASLLIDWDLLIYVDVTRWEIQMRQRRGEAPSLGLDNATERPALLYKRAFFLDWRAADAKKHELFPRVDFWIDGNLPEEPAMISGRTMQAGLSKMCEQPFSPVPYFDAGPWGGQWMRQNFDLPPGPPNYAWCFNVVPEENSLIMRFGKREFELPGLTLVHERPQALLGEDIYKRFGAEFPIRFDFLDTMGGGNLSLQVHPMRSYIREQFGMDYTQDESYYMMDAEPGAQVFLGLREGVDPTAMAEDLCEADEGRAPFPAEKYVNAWPAKKHDHFLIPAGTIHCSGKDSMVLEISATPYIFTFKLWDWGRQGMDGRPRPIHLKHGLKNIQWDRTTKWVKENLVNAERPIAEGDGWREESTGLHRLEFIETRRHWFTKKVDHDTHGTLNVVSLVEGDAAIVESPTNAFPPFTVHYAEAFIVPAAVGKYTIRPAVPATQPLATIKAYVRASPAQ
jgi:mannose-6-phosphate isomerase class I